MNEPAQRSEEQIISLFQDRETLVCQGWILKNAGNLCVDKRLQGSLFLKNGAEGEKTEYVMADAGMEDILRFSVDNEVT